MIKFYLYTCTCTVGKTLITSNNLAWIKNFNPITIGIFHKSQTLHSSFIWFFNKFNSQFFKSLACLLYIGYKNSNMTITPRFSISSMIFLFGIIFSSPVAKIVKFKKKIIFKNKFILTVSIQL